MVAAAGDPRTITLDRFAQQRAPADEEVGPSWLEVTKQIRSPLDLSRLWRLSRPLRRWSLSPR